MKKTHRGKINSYEMKHWKRALWIPWIARNTNKLVLGQIKPEHHVEIEAALLWAHHKKAGYSGKARNTGGRGR